MTAVHFCVEGQPINKPSDRKFEIIPGAMITVFTFVLLLSVVAHLFFRCFLCCFLHCFWFLLVMGPGSTQSKLPSYPKFSWNMRSCLWTDGRKDQEPHALAVRRWSQYHHTLAAKITNGIPPYLRGLTLHAQLYDLVIDFCRSIPIEVFASKFGVDAIIDALYKRDLFSM